MQLMSSHTVSAEMVANVAQVIAQVGDVLTPTDTVVILESMKMEIPVLADVHGTLREIAVNVGDVITEGDTIAVIEVAAR
jgi:acetyl-CoA carboxylase biotin carboxyl carrier protein